MSSSNNNNNKFSPEFNKIFFNEKKTVDTQAIEELQDLRFNKLGETELRMLDNKILKAKDYPLGKTMDIKALKESTKGDSIVVPGDVQLDGKKDENVKKWEKDNVTGANIDPIYPGEPGFWGQFGEVVQAQIDRENKVSPTESQWPQLWKGCTYEQIAEAVDGEYPASIQQSFIETVYCDAGKEGKRLILDLGQPFRSRVDFIGGPVRMAAINTWTFEAVAPVNFMLKWNYGMPRPEEIAWLIKTDRLTTEKHGVPEALVKCIKEDLDFDNAKAFTAYDAGSPTHPSFPAMHSAGSTCSLWLPVLYDITLQEYCEALLIDRGVAFGRTVAGVHYPQDNIAGLNIGQRIIREELPKFVVDRYGYDKKTIKERLEAFSFDWNDFKFEGGNITIDGCPAVEFFNNARKVGLEKKKK
eukprot:CAMPEP_0116138322 /NCGR_PEP_ID=MMETSP0329-20121206/12724_1 /TAXON_ID=697910 /ORGANISM="Pseudo-nitzschia arenysensis, Strain B593" /LENGTH=412 /DNA_ID=CAMNT_0003633305 /DNA_START=74 /DNA_END=1312 /DNA_ORIENTATION=+